jgi:hypothetical protein
MKKAEKLEHLVRIECAVTDSVMASCEIHCYLTALATLDSAEALKLMRPEQLKKLRDYVGCAHHLYRRSLLKQNSPD